MSQGASANVKGKRLENEIKTLLTTLVKKTMKHDQYDGKERSVLLLNAPYVKSINKTGLGKTEFVFVNEKGDHIRIECKRQGGGGSVIDKFDCLFKHCFRDMPEETIFIIVDGEVFDEHVLKILRQDIDEQKKLRNSEKNVRVMLVIEFVEWINEQKVNFTNKMGWRES